MFCAAAKKKSISDPHSTQMFTMRIMPQTSLGAHKNFGIMSFMFMTKLLFGFLLFWFLTFFQVCSYVILCARYTLYPIWWLTNNPLSPFLYITLLLLCTLIYHSWYHLHVAFFSLDMWIPTPHNFYYFSRMVLESSLHHKSPLSRQHFHTRFFMMFVLSCLKRDPTTTDFRGDNPATPWAPSVTWEFSRWFAR